MYLWVLCSVWVILCTVEWNEKWKIFIFSDVLMIAALGGASIDSNFAGVFYSKFRRNIQYLNVRIFHRDANRFYVYPSDDDKHSVQH